MKLILLRLFHFVISKIEKFIIKLMFREDIYYKKCIKRLNLVYVLINFNLSILLYISFY